MFKTLGIIAVVFLVLASAYMGGILIIRHNAESAKDQKIAQLEGKVNQLESEMGKLQERVKKAEGKIEELNMVASWYGPGFDGKKAADGTTFNQTAFTCAHKTLPFGTMLIVEYKGKRIPCVVSDRGPFVPGRDVDLSYAVASRIGMVRVGVDEVKVYKVNLDKILDKKAQE